MTARDTGTYEVRELALSVVDGTAQRVILARCACGARHFEPLRPPGLLIWECPKCGKIAKADVP